MKHYITAFVSQGHSDEDKHKTTDTYANLEHAGSTLSSILKNKLSQNWELNAFSNEDLAEIQGNIITMVQGENSSGTMAVIWALHSDPDACTKDGEMLPNYKNGGCDNDYSDEYEPQPERLNKMSSTSKDEKTKHPILSDSEYQVLSSNASVSKMNIFQNIIIACTIMTFIGFFSLPYGYYMLLKVLFFGSLAYFIFEYLNHSESTGSTLLVLAVLIILYNPIFPVELGSKALWIIVNLGTIGYLYSLSGIFNKKSNV